MRRGKYEIISDILDNARNPKTKTSIVYGANLSFEQAGKYLDMLIQNGLMEKIAEKNTKYKTTEKGREFVQGYNELENIVSEK